MQTQDTQSADSKWHGVINVIKIHASLCYDRAWSLGPWALTYAARARGHPVVQGVGDIQV